MKYYVVILSALFGLNLKAQNSLPEDERYPVFPDCESVKYNSLEDCFKNALVTFIIDHFETPPKVIGNNYTGEITVVFEVSKEGVFRLMYINAAYDELKDEISRIFSI